MPWKTYNVFLTSPGRQMMKGMDITEVTITEV